MRIDDDALKQLAMMARAYPLVFKYIQDWKDKEQNSLMYVGEKFGVAQGRVQILVELAKLMQDAPKMVTNKS